MKIFQFNEKALVGVDFERGLITDILYEKLCLTKGQAPVFAVKLRDRMGKTQIVKSTECNFVSFEDGFAKYTSSYFDAILSVKEKNNALNFRFKVKNKTDKLLEWVELAPFSVDKKLKDEGGKGEIVYPYNEGCLVTNMAYRESMPFKYVEPEYPSKNTFSIFPNMVFAQFIAYGVYGKGIYLGMHDNERTTKHVDFCYCNDSIKVFMRTFCNVSYGQDYEMPFDCVMKVYEGDWYNACDIYNEWFVNNLPNGLKKIDESNDLPKWYGESPLIVAYPLRGDCDTNVKPNGMYPYKNALPYLEEIASKTQSKVMGLLMHWEGTAPWAPPYSWPPYGGEREFSLFTEEMHSKDMLVGLYCSGMGWTIQSNVDTTYNCEQKFKQLNIKNCLCANSNGEIESIICTSQRKGYDMCPASEKTKEILKTEFDTICKSNVDYLQALDQNHGGNAYFCYSDKHGHPPAPGKWQQEETNKLLSAIDKNGVLFGCESSASEPFLAQLRFSDNRFQLNYYVGTPIPIYSYLYHEYVNNFMGNQICAMLEKKDDNFTMRVAYSFIAGDMLTVVLGKDGNMLYSWCDYIQPIEKNLDKETTLTFIKNLNSWRQNGGKNFLHLGKMIKPIKVHCGKEKFLLEDMKTYFTPDSVLTSAYEYNGERVQFIVNYNLNEVNVSFDKEYDLFLDSQLEKSIKSANNIAIAPLSAVMIKLN